MGNATALDLKALCVDGCVDVAAASKENECRQPNSNMGFQYHALDQDLGEIRLLKVLPCDKPSSPIECSLEHVPFHGHTDDDPSREPENWGPFVAISYVWGDVTKEHEIILEGRPFTVSLGLLQMLHKLCRMLSGGRLSTNRFWIDAISINQSDMTERNEQVTRMRYIFSLAESVYCFLPTTWPVNKTTEDSHAMQVVEPMNCTLATEMLHTLYENRQQENTNALISELRSAQRTFSDDSWYALFQFFTNPYWSRLWIMQEVALARHAYIVLDPDSVLDWDVVSAAAKVMRRGHYPMEIYLMRAAWKQGVHEWPHMHKIISIAELSAQYHGRVTERLALRDTMNLIDDTYWTVDIVRRALATDTRDKVYGILSLLSPQWSERVEVDYNKSVAQVHTESTAIGIELTGKLSALPHSPRMTTADELPSWVPDLSDSNIVRRFQRHYDAAGSLNSTWPAASIHGNRLIVHGVHLDTVLRITTRRNDPWARQRQNFLKFTPSTPSTSDLQPATRIPRDPTTMSHQLATTLLAGAKTDLIAHPYLPSFSSLQDLRATSYPAEGVFRFLEHSADFLLPNGETMLQVWEAEETVGDVDYSNIAIEMDYQTALRRLAVTERGRLALVSPECRVGDGVYALRGLDSLGLVRKEGGKGVWRWVGNCFVDGWMDGEGVAGREGEVETLTIV